MFKRPLLTIVALLHFIGILVLTCVDSRNLGERLADYFSLGLGQDDLLSNFGTRLLGRPFSAWNLVADLPSYLLVSLIASQVGIFGVWFSFGCGSSREKLKVLTIASLWAVCMPLLPPIVLVGQSVSAQDWLTSFPYFTSQVLGICGIVWLFRRTRCQGAGAVEIGNRFSLKQTFGLLSFVAIGLAMKGVSDLVAFTVLLSLITGISTCFAIWSWLPRSFYRMALSAVIATGLGIVSFLAAGDRFGREGTAWLFLSFSTAVAIQASFGLLGRSGRKEIGLT